MPPTYMGRRELRIFCASYALGLWFLTLITASITWVTVAGRQDLEGFLAERFRPSRELLALHPEVGPRRQSTMLKTKIMEMYLAGPGENAATAAALRGVDAAVTRRWLCYCRGRDEVPHSL
ncbi:hypothetical protein B0H13DRAFT_1893461 [Mycena leptocephala]|nr:hypothetical protein B0H13DRAFT_1893461 [Mycena leptocephala]